MKWHNLLLVIAALAFVVGTYADSIEIPDDIDDDDLDEDEEILRLLEEKRIVRFVLLLFEQPKFLIPFFAITYSN